MAKARAKKSTKKRKSSGKKRKSVAMVPATVSAPARRRRKSSSKKTVARRRKTGFSSGAKLISRETAIKAGVAFGVGYLDRYLENNAKVPAIIKKVTIPGAVFLAGVANEYFGLVKGNIGKVVKDAALAGALIYAYKFGITKGAPATAVKMPANTAGYDDEDFGYDDDIIEGELEDY